ncbi:hypothetical protein E0485_12640 [Paenibacillus albiflavus]|uniref:SLH domain-containing protein n=1 Tax=Paenibacillus albiflavus TaxID=2545760 RepID=A0A4R4EFG4_9BACL|nr:S-layer homology domain-containing protein [Paenibacillus albiflavus]TCZ76825.1 hypothetical protein E0485_12640 [Paenibacillus albiflavus]
MRFRKTVWIRTILILIGVFMCSGSALAATTTVSSIQFNESYNQITTTSNITLSVTARYSDSQTAYVSSRDVEWISSDNNIASVSNGIVSFTGQNGKVTIYATYQNKTTSLNLNVNIAKTVSNLVINDGQALTYSNNSTPMQVTAYYTDGTSDDIRSGLTWSSSDNTIAYLSGSYAYFTGKNGSVTLTANYGGKSSSVSTYVYNQSSYSSIKINEANLNYTSKPKSVQLTVDGIYPNNKTERIYSGIVWKVINPTNDAVATISQSGQLTFTGVNGSVTIIAEFGGSSATITATLNAPKALASLILNNDNPLSYTTDPVSLTVLGQYSDGTMMNVDNQEVSWLSNNPSVATVDQDGVVKFTGRNGSVTITGQIGNVSGSVTATVNNKASSLMIESVSPFIYGTNPIQLRVKDGSKYLNNAVWSSLDPTVATISPNGTVSFTGKNGVATINATFGDKTASISTVVNFSVSSVNIKETALTFSKIPLQLTAEAEMLDGHIQELSTAGWSSSDNSIATVSNTGLVKFTGKNGKVKITVQYGDREDSITTDVVNEFALQNIRIDEGIFYSSSPVTLTLTGVQANGKTEQIRGMDAKWTSSDLNKATISNGVVTYTGNEGWVTITAKYNGMTTEQSAYVSKALSIKSLRINEELTYTLNPVTLSLTATLPDGKTKEITASEAVWTSNDLSIADVSSNGIVKFKGKDGPVTITASYGNQKATVYVNVKGAITVESIKINELLKYSKTPITLTVDVTDTKGNKADVQSSSFEWKTSNASIAKVDKGVVTFTGIVGQVTITATLGGKTATVSGYISPNAGQGPFMTNVINNDTLETNMLKKIRSTNPLSSIPNYTDTSSHWANRQIKIGRKLDLITGYADDTFKPNQNITRGDFVIMLTRVFDIQPTTNRNTVFKDITNNAAKDAIITLNNLGIIGGYEDQTFRPDRQITRAEVVVILNKLVNVSQIPKSTNSKFTDISKHWAAESIKNIADIGLLSGRGDGTFAPSDNTTRAEAVFLLLRTLSLNPSINAALEEL